MKLMRYRKPSVKTAIGITKAKRQVKKATGISIVERYTKPARVKGRAKQKAGLYSPTARAVRQTSKGRFPTLFGFFRRK